MTHGEKEIQQLIVSAFRESATNGDYACAGDVFGFDQNDQFSEKYLVDAESVPASGPVSVVIYSPDNKEAWEVEIQFTVRDVASQPQYERLFTEHLENWDIDLFD